ncbi:unnamed protein product [Euphydryas editha]|uniref:Uncharacterized protein n=1 Tax=Euphydryas editha TaxID=104508 RepID=A0AAU9U3P6_EUPED|nr:unnamed protein product [Euphydryas editha]
MQECARVKIEEKFEFLELKLVEMTKCPDDKISILRRHLRFFKTQFKQKWKAASRKKDRFMSTNEDWLTSEIQVPNYSAEATRKPGRPTKCFKDLSERSKRRKTTALREQVPVEELTYAAEVSQRSVGNTDASVMIKKIVASPTRASKIRKSLTATESQVSVKKHTPQEALAIFVEGDFTRRQWEIIHNANKTIFPCYSVIQTAKKGCYPEKDTRLFETLLHLAYKIPLQKWQARSPAEKKTVKDTKEKIQRQFREEMGLLVDVPKAGFGNTNDGNTSRRFFADPDTSSRITGINVDQIKRFQVILEVISSGHNIDADKFDSYTQDTAKLYVQLYGWYPMSPTIHKVLIHGAQVITHALLPIGQLTEEAAEARNKNFRQYRLNFARKFSRTDCNRDIMNRLLLSSDPYLSSIRPKPVKKKTTFSTDALHLMISVTDEDMSYESTQQEDEADIVD